MSLLRVVDASGNSMLHLAVRSGNASCISFLIEAGLPATLANRMGHLPLHIAASSNQVECAEVLIKRIPILLSSPLSLSHGQLNLYRHGCTKKFTDRTKYGRRNSPSFSLRIRSHPMYRIAFEVWCQRG